MAESLEHSGGGSQNYTDETGWDELRDFEIDGTESFLDSDIARMAREKDAVGLQKLYEKYHRLAEYYAYKNRGVLQGNKVEQDDLIQEAMLAVMEAANNYDESKGAFSSYIVSFLPRRLRAKGNQLQNVVRLPSQIVGIVSEIYKINRSRVDAREAEMSDEEIAQKYRLPLNPEERIGTKKQITVLDIRDAIRLTRGIESIDSMNPGDIPEDEYYGYEERHTEPYDGYDPYDGHDEDNGYKNQSADEYMPMVSIGQGAVENGSTKKEAEANALREALNEVLQTLTEQEELIIRMRFGMDTPGICKTLDEVAVQFSVGKETIRRIEAKALRKLRHPRLSKRLKGAA